MWGAALALALLLATTAIYVFVLPAWLFRAAVAAVALAWAAHVARVALHNRALDRR